MTHYNPATQKIFGWSSEIWNWKKKNHVWLNSITCFAVRYFLADIQKCFGLPPLFHLSLFCPLSLLITAGPFLTVPWPHWFWLHPELRVAGSRGAHLHPVCSLIRDSLSQCSSAWCARISIEGFAKEAEKLIAVVLSLSELPAWEVGKEKPNSSLLRMTVIRQGKMRRTDAKRFARHAGFENSYLKEPENPKEH